MASLRDIFSSGREWVRRGVGRACAVAARRIDFGIRGRQLRALAAAGRDGLHFDCGAMRPRATSCAISSRNSLRSMAPSPSRSARSMRPLTSPSVACEGEQQHAVILVRNKAVSPTRYA